jgi:hypothetical protein
LTETAITCTEIQEAQFPAKIRAQQTGNHSLEGLAVEKEPVYALERSIKRL